MRQSITAGFYMEIVEVMVTTLIRMNILEFCSGVCYAKGALEIGLVPRTGATNNGGLISLLPGLAMKYKRI
jgi:hypothetical protein